MRQHAPWSGPQVSPPGANSATEASGSLYRGLLVLIVRRAGGCYCGCGWGRRHPSPDIESSEFARSRVQLRALGVSGQQHREHQSGGLWCVLDPGTPRKDVVGVEVEDEVRRGAANLPSPAPVRDLLVRSVRWFASRRPPPLAHLSAPESPSFCSCRSSPRPGRRPWSGPRPRSG
jgi:hypothetical protein